ncbi:AzlC family ABC transporter permease [Tistrella bauzanensis]|uniref:AzlC family ABC transporter permease n=1 Tax=Tistrella bauzanensis TaxID=657419 RepID=UPI003555DCF3
MRGDGAAPPGPVSRDLAARIWPVSLALTPVGLLFGILAAAQGWAVYEIAVVSLIGFTGSGQFVWLRLAGEGGGTIAAFAIILLINLRYLPMILTVSAPFRGLGPLKGVAAHMVSDESYAIEQPGDVRPARWMIRAGVFMTWAVSTTLGGLILPLITGTEAAALLALLAFFPASLLLFILSALRLEGVSRRADGSLSGRMTMTITAAAVVALGLYLVLGSQWFWLPSILVCAVLVDRFGFPAAAAGATAHGGQGVGAE